MAPNTPELVSYMFLVIILSDQQTKDFIKRDLVIWGSHTGCGNPLPALGPARAMSMANKYRLIIVPDEWCDLGPLQKKTRFALVEDISLLKS